MIASIQKLVESAGFNSGERQTVRMALTEAEAAAIEASTTQYRTGDVFLICYVRLSLSMTVYMFVADYVRLEEEQLTSIYSKSNQPTKGLSWSRWTT